MKQRDDDVFTRSFDNNGARILLDCVLETDVRPGRSGRRLVLLDVRADTLGAANAVSDVRVEAEACWAAEARGAAYC